MSAVFVLLGCLLGVTAVYGWGAGVLALTRGGGRNPALSLGFGLAVVVALGGVLNLLHLARPLVLDLVALVGVVAAIVDMIRHRSAPSRLAFGPTLVALVLALIPAAFVAATVVPTTVFNYIDDFSKYMAYPLRMVQTGTVAGSALDSLGLETLGGTAFLQGFVVGHLPITWVNAADALFGLFLFLLVGGLYAVGRGFGGLLLALPALAIAVLVTPQYANISALYLGGVLALTLFIAITEADGAPAPLVTGLITAALCALKTSFVPFALAALLTCLIAQALAYPRKPALVRGATTVLWAAGALAPWLLVSLPAYLGFVQGGAMAELPVPQDPAAGNPLQMFSFAPLSYGGSYGIYTVAALLAVVPPVLALFRVKHKSGAGKGLKLAAALALVHAGLFVVILGATIPLDFAQFTIRLLIPLLLGVAVGGCLLCLGSGDRVVKGVAVVLPIVFILPFLPEVPARLGCMVDKHSMLSFHWLSDREDYLTYSAMAVGGSLQDRVRALQERVPAGEPILAWVTAPFVLDFARNPLTTVDFMGLSKPWSRLPDARYVLWQFKGYGNMGVLDYEKSAHSPTPSVATAGRRGLALARKLQQDAKGARILFADTQFVLMELPVSLRSNSQ